MTDSPDNQSPKRAPSIGWWTATRSKPLFWVIIVGALVVGFLLRGGGESTPTTKPVASQKTEASSKATVWTCSMHPQVRLPKPGKCPICFMDLIPVTEDTGTDEGPRVLKMSETAKKLAQIVTTPVTRQYVSATIQMVGKVDYDETRIARIAAWIPGRLDQLYVDYTGVEVQKGDHMVLIYSPDLLAAQEELLQAVDAVNQTEKSSLGMFRETVYATVRSARDKLRLWGLADQQIAEIEKRGTPTDHMTIYAPIGGVVVERNALEGQYVKTGTPIYTIVDLSEVWLKLEAYESDLEWLRYGQSVTFTTEALPGEEFHGRVAFIDPVLNYRTRTVSVRVNVPNKERKLKPGMFVRAKVKADVAAGGLIIDASLVGHWICPMHPDVISTGPGNCRICGMKLVSIESLGYVDVTKANTPPPLVIPASAPLITGKRAVVYVQLPNRERPTYEGREVVLGPRAGDFYIVESGLKEGEMVVVNGNFKIDSELQIRARPSMMSPPESSPPPAHHGGGDDHAALPTEPFVPKKTPAPHKQDRLPQITPAFEEQLAPVYTAYFDLQKALATDSQPDAAAAERRLSRAVTGVNTTSLDVMARTAWTILRGRINDVIGTDTSSSDLTVLRARFAGIAATMIDLNYQFGHPDSLAHFVDYCPMALDKRGAYWLQNTETIANPFFGGKMPRCGKVTDRIHPNQPSNHD